MTKREMLEKKYGGKWKWTARSTGGSWKCDDGKREVRQRHRSALGASNYIMVEKYDLYENGELIKQVDFNKVIKEISGGPA